MKIMLFCFSTLFCALGCTKNNNNSSNTLAADIFPNKIGDTWVYLVNDTTIYAYSQHPNVIAQYNMTVSITDSVGLNNVSNALNGYVPAGIGATVWVYNDNEGTDTNYVFQKEDTIRFIDKTKSEIVRQYIIPLSLHNSWQYIPAPGINTAITVDSQSNIIVGQTNFDNAFHISGDAGYPDAIFSVEEWFANNAGLVKRNIDNGGISGINNFIKWSLISYHLK